jgi:hypothetical protein
MGMRIKCKKRPDVLEDLTCLQFLKKFDFRSVANMYERRNARDRVLNYFPIYPPSSKEDFSRVKLMLRHRFRQIDVLKLIDVDAPWESFEAAYGHFTKAHSRSYLFTRLLWGATR